MRLISSEATACPDNTDRPPDRIKRRASHTDTAAPKARSAYRKSYIWDPDPTAY